MKKKPCILFVLMAIFVFCALCLSACQYRSGQRWSGNYWYTVENEEVTITGYTGLAKDLTIPDTINGMPVVAIGGIQSADAILHLKDFAQFSKYFY